MIVVRFLDEPDNPTRSHHSFLATMTLEKAPEVGDTVAIGDGDQRREGEVVRIYRPKVIGDALFAVEEPWVVLRFR